MRRRMSTSESRKSIIVVSLAAWYSPFLVYAHREVMDLLADRFTGSDQHKQVNFAINAKVYVVAAGECPELVVLNALTDGRVY